MVPVLSARFLEVRDAGRDEGRDEGREEGLLALDSDLRCVDDRRLAADRDRDLSSSSEESEDSLRFDRLDRLDRTEPTASCEGRENM